jgi:hypothetical protein
MLTKLLCIHSWNTATVIANAHDATALLVEKPVPTNANTLRIFQVCGEADGVFRICGLNKRQKLAMIQQGVNSVAKLQLLRRDQAAIQVLIKPIAVLPLNCGGTEFGINIIMVLAAVIWFYDDHHCLGMAINAGAFGTMELTEYEAKILNEDDGLSNWDNKEVEGPGKLKVNNFITWKEGLHIKL